MLFVLLFFPPPPRGSILSRGDTRTKNNEGSTPLLAACEGGHLDVTQWLFITVASEDTGTARSGGWTPFLGACDVVAWRAAHRV